MLKAIARLSLLGFIPFILPECKKSASVNIVGSYAGKYDGGVETFTLRADGTFTQEFVKTGMTVYLNSGNWKIKKDNVIQFTNFMRVHNIGGGAPTLFSDYEGTWEATNPGIIFSQDEDYWILKQ